ncbi:MAG: ACT domain-containing protein [Chloroflexi bacterium]|nr:ACT domain-containing protein [Chloroflexota bacterium]
MEIRERVREVVVEDGWALIKVAGVPDQPGIAAKIFGRVAEAGLSVDLILQNASADRVTDVSFTVRQRDLARAKEPLAAVQQQIGARGVETLDDLTKLQLVGTGIMTDPAYVGRMFKVLADAGVNILAIGTSEIRISCLIKHGDAAKAQKALNAAFQTAAA